MTEPYRIARATEADLPALCRVARESFEATFRDQNTEADMQAYLDAHFNSETLQTELLHAGSEFYLAFDGDRAGGYLKINHGAAQTEPMGPEALEIQRIYVLPDYLGRGMGAQLLGFGIDRGRALGASLAWLGVWEHNDRALAFYTRYGFEVYGRHDFVLGIDVQTDLLMRRRI